MPPRARHHPPRRATPAPRRLPLRRGARGQTGSLSLEAAMAIPVVALSALALLQLVGVARDALLAQDLARVGARVAAVDPSDAAVVDAVRAAAGGDVDLAVDVTPSARHHADTITVTVRLRREGRWFDVDLTGTAASHGEPILDTGGGP